MLKLGKRRQREDYSFGERQTNAKNIREHARLHFVDRATPVSCERAKHTRTGETSLRGRATQGRRVPQGSRGACILPRQQRLLEVYGIRNTLLTLIWISLHLFYCRFEHIPHYNHSSTKLTLMTTWPWRLPPSVFRNSVTITTPPSSSMHCMLRSPWVRIL